MFPRSLRRDRCPALLALLICLSSRPLAAQSAPGHIAFEQYALPNGLSVILSPDHTSQVVAVDIWYRAGSRDEPPVRAGLARLFERLMYAGSANVPPGGHAAIVENVGGHGEAGADEDIARYIQSLPSNRLNLGLWLEADRMGSLAINDTTIAEARDGLLGELQQKIGEEAYTAAVLDAVASLYDSTTCPGYTHPPTGRVQTITAISTADVQGFYRRHYNPSNARLVVTGDFDPTEARSLIRQYFGDLPTADTAPAVSCGVTFAPGARTLSTRDRLASQPAVGLFYRIPGAGHADMPALQLLGLILGRGRDARLAQVLGGPGLAIATQAGVLGDRVGPSAFGLFAVAADGVSADSLQALLEAQVRWIMSDSLGEAELARAKHIFRATTVSGRERAEDIAEALHHAATFRGGADAVNTDLSLSMSLTLADVRRIARTWFVPANAVTLVVAPGAGR
ncbi:MAG: pitrilysin family protein [Gemmatimonadota bacterium]|nr:pitrilysin family protein [Gemmatimonadota bacterium]